MALVVNLGAGSLAAYFVTRLPRRAQARYIRFVLFGTVVPFILLIVPYYRIYDALGVLNSPAAIGVAYGALGLPTTILILYAHFIDFPPSLLDASGSMAWVRWGHFGGSCSPSAGGPWSRWQHCWSFLYGTKRS